MDIPEGAKVGTELKISGPVDRDSKPEFTVQHYNITPAMATFSIHPTTNLDGSVTINLRLEKELDRETKDEYRFDIFAYDGSPTPQSESLGVAIRVTDDNDNAPRFTQSKYEIIINEHEKIGAQVAQVTATDSDIGDYGRISYSFSSNSVKGIFSIDPANGWISLQGDLRTIRKNTSPCLLFVDAKDGGDPPLSSQACVQVTLSSSGIRPPTVVVNTVTAGDVSTLSIPESAVLDHFVAFIDIEDNDDGDSGQVTCQIVSGPEFKLSPNLYTGMVDENRDAGQFIAQVLAQDADAGINAEITYSIPKEAQEYIRVNSRTGIVSTNSPLDREANATLRFKVFATDSGSRPRTGVAEISIIVKDINDNNPQFSKPKFVFFVSENIANNTFIGELTGYDLDVGTNGQYDFYFGGSSKGDSPLPFAVLRNGSVQVTGSLDRESKAQYSFTAIVRDRGEVPRSNTVAVEIKVLDENDNDPVILFPTSNNHTIVISNTPENGMILGRIIAYDVDEDDIAGLRYSIYEGNDDGAFSIGLSNGELMLVSTEHLKNPQDYYLSIKVEDATTRPRNASTQLRIEVRFENISEVSTYTQNEQIRDHYVVIVGVIGGATVVLSVIIISAIFFILHSDKNRRSGKNGSFFKNNFCNATAVQAVVDEKQVDSLDATKSQSNSSIGSDQHGVILSPGNLGKKHEDVHKKVSFSLQDEFHDQGQVLLPEKQICFNLPLNTDSHSIWKKYNNPDDINSDASGESGTCDSGRGTSDEDIKFDHSPGRGSSRPLDHYRTARDGLFDQFTHQNAGNTRPVQNLQGGSRLQAPTLPPKPEKLRLQDTGRHDGFHGNYYDQRQPPLSSTFVPNVHSNMRQSSHTTIHKPNRDNQAGSAVSMDDDASTTTSGSYIMNSDDVMLDGFMGKDVVV
ncbi:unnamed protein product [Candidula unifasciata]|uniref:Cadherin domain-containing protein n=1 Tax=Candidula unifasciata TaxID=100452 RepID=A0A8S3Z358_9EUPU|nr:unnamed protein product [Candidula unifasciata]